MKKYYIVLLLSCVGLLSKAQEEHSTTQQATLHDPIVFGMEEGKPESASTYFYVGSEAFENSPEINVAKALYGVVPGLQVKQNAGPSSSNNASLSLHGKTPLVLIDGFTRGLGEITPQQIESVTVLTDATATALYGLEGANGVVLVTTKRGKDQKLKVTAHYQHGLTTAMREPQFSNSYTYANKLNEALLMNGEQPRYNHLELDAFKNGIHPYEYPNVDWLNQVYNNYAYNHQVGFTFSGGNDKFRYFSAIDYMHDESLFRSEMTDNRYNVRPTDTRLSVRANIDVNLTPTTYLQMGVSGRIGEVNESAKQDNAASAVYRTPSGVFPVRNHLGVYGSAEGYGANNPVALLYSTGNHRYSSSMLNANLSLRQELDVITDGLYVDATVRFDNSGAMSDNTSMTYRYEEYNPTINEYGILITNPAFAGENAEVVANSNPYESLTMLTDLRARVAYDLNKNGHYVNAYAMFNLQSLSYDGRNNTTNRMSFLAKATYGYKNRYFLDAVVNYAGTAYLPTDKKFNLYPAVSLGWVASNESFLKDAKGLDFLKLSLSYGLSGSDGSLEHEMYRQFYGGDNARQYYFTKNWEADWGQAENDLPVEIIAPERSEKMTATLDARFLDNRLSLFAHGYYDKRSNILITTHTVSSVIGIETARQCVGENNYWGADLSLNWKDKVGDFSYAIHATGGYLGSEVVNSGQAYQQYDYLYHKRNPVSQTYGLEAIGIFQDQMQINNSPKQLFSDEVKPGDIMYKDQNGDNVINQEDMVCMFGTRTPTFNFGFGLEMGYKGFELSADFQGAAGVTGSLLSSPLYNPLVNDGNISDTYLSREVNWTPERNSEATMPRLTTLPNANNNRNSSWWYRDFSFLKLRNVSLSYTLPKTITRFADIKVYLRGTDLFSIDKLGFADPENIASVYPMTRTYWAGVKFNF